MVHSFRHTFLISSLLTSALLASDMEADFVLHPPFPSRVQEIHVAPGAFVERGQPLVTIEAMKMYITMSAPMSGYVGDILASVGDMVTPSMPMTRLASMRPALMERGGFDMEELHEDDHQDLPTPFDATPPDAPQQIDSSQGASGPFEGPSSFACDAAELALMSATPATTFSHKLLEALQAPVAAFAPLLEIQPGQAPIIMPSISDDLVMHPITWSLALEGQGARITDAVPFGQVVTNAGQSIIYVGAKSTWVCAGEGGAHDLLRSTHGWVPFTTAQFDVPGPIVQARAVLSVSFRSMGALFSTPLGFFVFLLTLSLPYMPAPRWRMRFVTK